MVNQLLVENLIMKPVKETNLCNSALSSTVQCTSQSNESMSNIAEIA